MANTIDNSEQIILGSGDLFLAEFTGTIPEDSVIETDENRAGNIKGGATLEYSQSSQTVKDDKGRVTKTVTTEEDVKLKTGLITWVDAWIEALISTARVDTASKSGHRIYKIGGLNNQHKKRYLFRFVHTRDDGRKLRVTVTGKNTGTISLAFTTENPTTVDAEITASTLDTAGTLVIIDDEMLESETAEADTAQSVSGTDDSANEQSSSEAEA